MTRRSAIAASLAVFGLVGHVPFVCAQEVAGEVAVTDPQIEELRRAISVRDQVIRNLITRIENLERSMSVPAAPEAGPQLLGSLRWKLATARDAFDLDEESELPFGSGFQTLTASLTGVSVLGPVVFFGTLSYTESLGARKGINRIDPGDRIGLQLGMALALNLETSLSLAFEQSFNARTRVDGMEVPGTFVNTGTASIGMSRTFPSGRAFDASLAIGLSEDSPDLQLGFSMPFRR